MLVSRGFDPMLMKEDSGYTDIVCTLVTDAARQGVIIYPVLEKNWGYSKTIRGSELAGLFLREGLRVVDLIKQKYSCIPKYAKLGVKGVMNLHNLDTSVCYVEAEPVAGRPDKFLATRSLAVIEYIIGTYGSKHDLEYYKKYLNSDIGGVSLLKIRLNKTNVSITVPKSTFNIESIRVLPYYHMASLKAGLSDLLISDKLVEFMFIKDNGTERALVSSVNTNIIAAVYGADYINKLEGVLELHADRGYIRIPEIGLSRYDESGMRSLNLMRILGVNVGVDLDTSFIEVDFNSIVPSFKNYIDGIRSKGVLSGLYRGIAGGEVPASSADQVRYLLSTLVDQRVISGSTEFLMGLHTLMMSNPSIFKGYTGVYRKDLFSNENNLGEFETDFDEDVLDL